MADIEFTSTSEEGFVVSNVIDDEWELTVDATGQEGPDPNQVLAADYASCFIPAVRVAGDQLGYDDLGTVAIEGAADLDEDDDLESTDWTLQVETDVSEDAGELVDLAEDICHVHSALREGLHAEIDVESGVDF